MINLCVYEFGFENAYNYNVLCHYIKRYYYTFEVTNKLLLVLISIEMVAALFSVEVTRIRVPIRLLI